MNLFRAALVAFGLALAGAAAHAAVSCSIGASPGFTIASYTEGTAASQASTVAVSCTRGTTGDPATINYTLTFDTGNNNNRAAAVVSGTTYYISYTKAASTSCTPAITTATGSFTWPNNGPPSGRTGTQTGTANYAGCIAAQSGMAAATYIDSIGLTLANSANATTASGTAPVSITMSAACTLSTPPGTMTFNYTAFRASLLTVNVPFAVDCTNTTPYTMSLDVTQGTAAGLAYSLALSSPGGTGSGNPQGYNIIGTMAAGQPGDCTGSCTGSNVHNLTISY